MGSEDASEELASLGRDGTFSQSVLVSAQNVESQNPGSREARKLVFFERGALGEKGRLGKRWMVEDNTHPGLSDAKMVLTNFQ